LVQTGDICFIKIKKRKTKKVKTKKRKPYDLREIIKKPKQLGPTPLDKQFQYRKLKILLRVFEVYLENYMLHDNKSLVTYIIRPTVKTSIMATFYGCSSRTRRQHYLESYISQNFASGIILSRNKINAFKKFAIYVDIFCVAGSVKYILRPYFYQKV